MDLYTLFTLDESFRSQKKRKYHAYCKESGPLFNSLQTLGKGSKYFEVHWSTSAYDVPLLFAIKGKDVYGCTPEGVYKKLHHCTFKHGISMTEEKLAPVRENFSPARQLPFNKCELAWNTIDGLVPGHQVILNICLARASSKTESKKVDFEWEYVRSDVYSDEYYNDIVYQQYVGYNGQRYEVHRGKLRITEEHFIVYAVSDFVPTTLLLEDNFDEFLAANDPALVAAFMGEGGTLNFALKKSLEIDAVLPFRFEIETEEVSAGYARAMESLGLKVPRQSKKIKKVDVNLLNRTSDSGGVYSGLSLEEENAILEDAEKELEEATKRCEADPEYQKYMKDYQKRRAEREKELDDALEKGDLDLFSQLMISEL